MTQKISALFLSVFFVILLFITPAHAADSEWLQGGNAYNKLFSENQKKGFLVYFYTDWCGYCKRFSKNTLSNPEALKFLSKIEKVKVNPEAGDIEDTIADNLNVETLPTVFVIKNKVATPISTQGTPEEFIRLVKNAL